MKRGRVLMAGLGGLGVSAAVAAALCLGTGCSTISYYAQSVGGHVSLLNAARPVSEWMTDRRASLALKERLALTQRIRDFAVSELHLPDNASYRRYAELGRVAAVWNVVAAPELSLQLKTWCFPVVGCVGYRGYFDRAGADELAGELRAQGFEVSVYGVPAYSTLGTLPGEWLADPLLSTFIHYPEGELARLIFHELAHQIAYANDDTMFNESFATAVERIGGARWLERHASAQAREEYLRLDSRRHDFRTLTRAARDRLDALYRSDAADAAKRVGKQAVLEQLRAEHAAIKAARWDGFAGYDAWFAHANNASLGVLAAYNELVPDFEALFEREGRDFPRFYAAVRRLADMPKSRRRAALSGDRRAAETAHGLDGAAAPTLTARSR